MSCGACRFACGFPEPGPEPVKPEPPKGWFARLFWDDPAADGWHPFNWAMIDYRDSVNRHANLVRCRRFPKQVTKHKTATCGEFQPAP